MKFSPLFLSLLIGARLFNSAACSSESASNRIYTNASAIARIENLEQKLESEESARQWNVIYALSCVGITTYILRRNIIYANLWKQSCYNEHDIKKMFLLVTLTGINLYINKKRQEKISELTTEIAELKEYVISQQNY